MSLLKVLRIANPDIECIRCTTFTGCWAKMRKLRFPVVFTNLMTHSGAEFPKGFKKLEMISRTPQVFLDNISEECDQKLYYYWDVVLGIYPAGLIEEMFSGYARVLETLKADLKKWKQIDLKEVIKAQPEKYGDILLDTGGA